LPSAAVPKNDISPYLHMCRRKYEFQQFLSNQQQLSCVSQNGKHHYQQQQSSSNRYGLGHAFRNSWRRKEDHKPVKKAV
jgi:hypothetical protein